jgi:hypothetical protein
MPLDREQLEHYWDRGFLLLESLIDTGSLARWSQRFEDIVLGRIPTPEHLTVMKDVMVVQGATQPASPLHAVAKILSFENDPVLWEYPTEARLLDAVRSIIGRELRSISSNVFNKPPGVDGRFPLHQDLRYFTLRPAGKIVATWTAITQTTRVQKSACTSRWRPAIRCSFTRCSCTGVARIARAVFDARFRPTSRRRNAYARRVPASAAP